MRLRTTFKLIFFVALAAFLYGGYLFNETRWGRKWQPADAILPTNVKYYGALKDGYLEGPGELVGADGSHFVGEFHRGLIHGKGEWRDLNATYTGEFANGMFNGEGTLIYHNGMSYTGEFRNNRMHGKGRMEWPNGDTFEGEFADDQMALGIFREKNGGVYEGAFTDGLYGGKGTYTSANGDRYSGDFVAGNLTGKGRIELTEGVVYEGEILDWIYNGQGTLTDPRGVIYTGAFEDGLYHGPGELRFQEPDGGEVHVLEGNWIHGEFEGVAAEMPATRKKPRVEDLLYNQPALLDAAAAAVAEQTPEHIDFYFLGMAGDGEQEIFLRELRYVSEQLSQPFNIAQRQILLVNNRNTVQAHPLATRTSLARAVDVLGNKMDKSQDILLLYLTSHGSAEHEFHIAMPGLELPAISKDDLSSILDNSGVRWRVVIISACYSGGFIPGLQNENTLIITAARDDRRSFGCDDRNDMTYFARAYFKESLAQTTDFIAAFDNAKNLISEWEEKDFPEDERSEPQIFIGEKIREHLRIWVEQSRAPVAAP
jgi:hypothetical protein